MAPKKKTSSPKKKNHVAKAVGSSEATQMAEVAQGAALLEEAMQSFRGAAAPAEKTTIDVASIPEEEGLEPASSGTNGSDSLSASPSHGELPNAAHVATSEVVGESPRVEIEYDGSYEVMLDSDRSNER